MNTTIGENIRTMRRKCGFTQEELANLLSVTPQAVSKWENGNGMPDVTQLDPLAQIFGITTDSLLGVISASYGKAHTEACLGHERILMSSSQSAAEKALAAYTYYRAESEKEPTNYVIMRRCINHGADISMHTDLFGFLADNKELRNDIFEDCERKNICISRYCDDRNNVEKSDYAMAWIYIHLKQFDTAQKLIDRLPSLESNNLKETIMTQLIFFRDGFETEKEYIFSNVGKLFNATAKEFYHSLTQFTFFSNDPDGAAFFMERILGIMDSFKSFDNIRADVLYGENRIRRYTPRCYTEKGDIDRAAASLIVTAENFCEIARLGGIFSCSEDMKSAALSEIETAVNNAGGENGEKLRCHEDYRRAVEIIEGFEV